MANGLEAFRDELPPSAASIILQVQSQQWNALAGTWGRDLRPPLKLDDSVEKQYFYRKRAFQRSELLSTGSNRDHFLQAIVLAPHPSRFRYNPKTSQD